MPSYIVKANRHEDFYVEWSTIVDAPLQWGPAADFRAAYMPADRKARADQTGTSSFDGFYGWDQQAILVANMGDQEFYDLPRENLKAFLEALGAHPDNRNAQQAALDRYATRVGDEP